MFIATSQLIKQQPITLAYHPDDTQYVMRLSPLFRVYLDQSEIEELYNEILGALMHRRSVDEGLSFLNT